MLLLGTPFSDCMADIDGPYQNPSVITTPIVKVIRASESEPAVFYCRYTCHDEIQDNQLPLYNFWLHVDILDECLRNEYKRISVLNSRREFADLNFTVTTTIINECNRENNMTTFEAQVFVGLYAPPIVAKCYMKYFPDGDVSRQTNCSSSSTFAIINNDATCAQDPTSTEPPTVTSSTEPPSPTPTTTESVTGTNSTEPPTIDSDEITMSAPAFGLMVGILCAIVAIETLLLIIFGFFFLKYKKFRGNLNKVTTIQVRENTAAQK